jgi:hypothetical protein
MPGYLDLARGALAAVPPEQNCPENEVNEQSRPWDHAAADSLLTNLRADVARLKQDLDGAVPPALAAVAADLLSLAEGYVRDHEREAIRGWDALELLRRLRPALLGAVANALRENQRGGRKR